MSDRFGQIEEFDWQEWVIEKLISKHGVTPEEVEECFFNPPHRVVAVEDDKYRLFAQSESGRYLFVVYAWKDRNIRVISARDMTAKERKMFRRK